MFIKIASHLKKRLFLNNKRNIHKMACKTHLKQTVIRLYFETDPNVVYWVYTNVKAYSKCKFIS